jgi:hypothetical protein
LYQVILIHTPLFVNAAVASIASSLPDSASGRF